MTARNTRRTLSGIVTSDGMDKTIAVNVERRFRHPKYGKYVRRDTKYLVHDENNDAKVGDTVDIAECRPLSKNKRWRLVQVVARGDGQTATTAENPEKLAAETAAGGDA